MDRRQSLLIEYKEKQREIESIEDTIAEPLKRLSEIKKQQEDIKYSLKVEVEKNGDFNALGFKAWVTMRRVGTFSLEKFSQKFPDLVDEVMETVVSKQKVDLLVSDERISPEDLEDVQDYKETPVFYLKEEK